MSHFNSAPHSLSHVTPSDCRLCLYLQAVFILRVTTYPRNNPFNRSEKLGQVSRTYLFPWASFGALDLQSFCYIETLLLCPSLIKYLITGLMEIIPIFHSFFFFQSKYVDRSCTILYFLSMCTSILKCLLRKVSWLNFTTQFPGPIFVCLVLLQNFPQLQQNQFL